MEIMRTAGEMLQAMNALRHSGKSLGFIPTMGFLHEGHLSLARAAQAQNDQVAVSIYVNPTQFGPAEDFQQYPRDEARDARLLEEAGTHWLFLPTPEEIYPPEFSTFIEPPSVSRGWCGRSRPGHFRGVCTVVAILFNIVQPTRAYFGQKDAQQAAVIRRMTQDLRFPIEIVVCPIVREADGLALSSRNVNLSAEERTTALILTHTLARGVERFRAGERNAAAILTEGRERIEKESRVKLDYLGIVDHNTFQSHETVEKGNLYLGAIYVGRTRLIDNRIFET